MNLQRLAGATVAITSGVPISVQQLEQLPSLQMISLAMTGTDAVDLDYCRQRGIHVSNVPGHGPIAQQLAELATRLEMEVYFHDRDGHYQGERYLALEQLARLLQA